MCFSLRGAENTNMNLCLSEYQIYECDGMGAAATPFPALLPWEILDLSYSDFWSLEPAVVLLLDLRMSKTK